MLFITLAGWRLIPKARREHDSPQELFELREYIAEVRVPDGSGAVGKRVRELDETAEENDAAIIGLVRRGQRMPGLARARSRSARTTCWFSRPIPTVSRGWSGHWD